MNFSALREPEFRLYLAGAVDGVNAIVDRADSDRLARLGCSRVCHVYRV